MTALHRRLLRLETANGRHAFAHLADGELDARLRAELAAWLRRDPGADPVDARVEVAAFLAVADAGECRSWRRP